MHPNAVQGAAGEEVAISTSDQTSASMHKVLQWVLGLIHIGHMPLADVIDTVR